MPLPCCCTPPRCAAQPAPAAPSPSQLTFYYDYTVKPGKEQEFLDLVKTLGGPVRDRLMAEGVISEWGVEQPLLRGPEVPTYSVWYVTSSLAGVGKVQAAMAEMLGQSSAGAAAARGSRVSTNADRARELLETTRTRDWLIRDLENGYGTKMPAAGAQPYIRYNAIKVRPGKGREFRLAWDSTRSRCTRNSWPTASWRPGDWRSRKSGPTATSRTWSGS